MVCVNLIRHAGHHRRQIRRGRGWHLPSVRQAHHLAGCRSLAFGPAVGTDSCARPGYRRCMDAQATADELLQDAARLAVHPAFAQAVEVYCTALARLREAPRLLNTIIATDVRWRIVGYLLYLSSDTERFGPHGGATYGRLLQLCTKRQEAGSRALTTLLGLLRLSRLILAVPDWQDARIKYYVPTKRLNRFVQGWMRYATAALDLLEPEMARARFLDDPAFLTRFNVSGGRAHLADAIPLADRVPEPLSLLKSMLGSYSVIVGVMEADLGGRPVPPAGHLARRFGLSRTQVREIIAAGLRAGLFAQGEKDTVTATPALRDSFAHWISIELAFYARHMRRPEEAVSPVADHLT